MLCGVALLFVYLLVGWLVGCLLVGRSFWLLFIIIIIIVAAAAAAANSISN